MGKVMIVDHTAESGGAELALLRYARRTVHDVTFVFLAAGGVVDRMMATENSKVVVPGKRLGFIAQLRFLRKALRSDPSALVLSNTLRAALMTTLLNPQASHVLLLHDGVDRGSLSLSKRALLRWLVLPRVDAIFCNSEWTRSTLPPRFSQTTWPVVYSLSGVERTSKAPMPSAALKLRILSISRLVEWKGIHVLLESLALMASNIDPEDIEVTIAGSPVMGTDGYLDRLHQAARTLPFSVTFSGQTDDVDALLRSHDVLVLASIRPEPFGQVIVQGMSSGLFVVAPAAGGPAELIHDGVDGVLFHPGDRKDLAAALTAALSQPSRRREIAEAARARATDFSDEATASMLDKALSSVIKGGHR